MENEKNESHGKRVFVVAGLGDIGLAFAKELSKYGAIFGISRTPKEVDLTRYTSANLLHNEDVRKVYEELPTAAELVYLHLVGKFAFEDDKHPIRDENKDGIDDDIYKTNVETFRNIRPYLTKYLINNPQSTLKAIGIGSSSDIYDIPFWHSFTHSKNELRKELRKFYGNPDTFGRAGTLLINVSTVSGTQLSNERPFISREFCLTPKEVVEGSLDYVLDKKVSCLEMTLVKPNPHFSEPDYLSLPKIKERWYRDMHGEPK